LTGYESEKKILTVSPSVATVGPPHCVLDWSAGVRAAPVWRTESRNAGAADALEARKAHATGATRTRRRLTWNSMPDRSKRVLRIR
jgi:hypothetical protein